MFTLQIITSFIDTTLASIHQIAPKRSRLKRFRDNVLRAFFRCRFRTTVKQKGESPHTVYMRMRIDVKHVQKRRRLLPVLVA